MKQHYIDIYQRTIDYIEHNLFDELSLEQIAKSVYCSKYHLHRIFNSVNGQTIGQHIIEQKLNKAAYQLVFRSDLSITDIGLATGFANSESFSRAFKRVYQQTPREYRNNPIRKPWLSSQHDQKEYSMKNHSDIAQVEIVYLDDIELAVLSHVGHPATLHDTLNTFIQWRKANGLTPNKYRTFNLFENDPTQVPPEEFSVGICTQVPSGFSNISEDITLTSLPAGRYAKLRHKGSEAQLPNSINTLYRDWLINSDEMPKDFPLILERLTLYPDVDACDNIIDIYVALND
ncbi:AraC family transcriptional regulator [Thalassotalea fusca]